MAATATPYGFRPTNTLGYQATAGGFRLYKITAAYGTSIFYGDLVKLVAGTCEKDSGTTTATPIGVFGGVEYEDTAMGLLHRQFWTASTVVKTNTTAWAYVYDDPDMLFEIQCSAAATQANIGQNAALVQTAGSTATGMSAVTVNAATFAATATLPVRVVDYVRRPGSTLGDAKTDVIVRLNTHFNRTALGI